MDVLNKLPAEIWLNIFQQLDKKSLSASTQTCHAWHDFIFASSEIVGKFRLKIDSYDRKDKYFIERFGCNFRNVEIGSNRRNSKKLNLSFRQTGSLLESLENVEKLAINNVTFKFWQSPDYKIEFPYLESMKLGKIFRDSKVFVAFRNVQLEELLFDRYLQTDVLESEFLEWFSAQNQLKNLECYGDVAKIIITKSSNRNYKLKRLAFNSRKLIVEDELTNFFRFQDELEECEVALDGSGFINDLILNLLVNMKSLKKCRISRNISENYISLLIVPTHGNQRSFVIFQN